MTTQEILDLEATNNDKIHLLREGGFWIAYEKSAFRWAKTVKPYKIKKKFVKTVGCEVVSLGFPTSALDAIVTQSVLEKVEETEKQVTFVAPDPLTDEEFNEWKAAVELFETKPKQQDAQTEATGIARQILDFGIESATPIECMNFLAELKRQIRDERRETKDERI
ncbi:MAG: hypothetical protein LBM63_04375 [Rikenellaceae bacterium]|jgi:hypothetical protein|nr:hypothetical protein [Rikenellaceae bacterium]